MKHQPVFRWMMWAVLSVTMAAVAANADDGSVQSMIFDPGPLKPVDSVLTVAVDDPAPSFALPSLSGETVSLAHYRDRKNVVIFFQFQHDNFPFFSVNQNKIYVRLCFFQPDYLNIFVQ